jgi:hypothetical protein
MKTVSKIAAVAALFLALGLVISCGSKSLAKTRWEWKDPESDEVGYIAFTSDTDFSIGSSVDGEDSAMGEGTYKINKQKITLTINDGDSVDADYDGKTISANGVTFKKVIK